MQPVVVVARYISVRVCFLQQISVATDIQIGAVTRNVIVYIRRRRIVLFWVCLGQYASNCVVSERAALLCARLRILYYLVHFPGRVVRIPRYESGSRPSRHEILSTRTAATGGANLAHSLEPPQTVILVPCMFNNFAS